MIEKIKPDFTVGDSHFGPELMTLTAAHGFEAVEVPVNYLERVGVSSVTGSLKKTFVLAIVMTFFIFKQFIKFRVIRPIIRNLKRKKG